MRRVIVSLGFLLTISLTLFSQAENKLDGQSLSSLEQLLVQTSHKSLFSSDLIAPLLKKVTVSENNNIINHHRSSSMPLVYAYKDLALFCKLEVKLEKVVKLPVKFRLGSVDYVDWLEGKRDQY